MIVNTVKELDNGRYLVNDTIVVPIDEGNADYQAVKEWMAKGNVPEPAYTFEELLSKKLKELSDSTTNYIEKYYPKVKQMSDVADKEYDGTALLMINPNYTLDQIYRDAGVYANEIIAGTTTIADIVATLPSEEQPHWEQVLKVATRVAWVKACKAVHAEYTSLLEAATDQATLDQIDIFMINFPKYPLI